MATENMQNIDIKGFIAVLKEKLNTLENYDDTQTNKEISELRSELATWDW